MWSFLKSHASARQQATDSGGTSLVRTHTHAHLHTQPHLHCEHEKPEHTENSWAIDGTADSAIPVSDMVSCLWRQDECLYCPPGLLFTLPKGNCLLSSLMSMASPHCAANSHDGSWRSKQESRRTPLSLERNRALRPPRLPLKPQGWLSCYFSPAHRPKCIHTLV